MITDRDEHQKQNKELPERTSLTELERNVEMVSRVVPEIVKDTTSRVLLVSIRLE